MIRRKMTAEQTNYEKALEESFRPTIAALCGIERLDGPAFWEMEWEKKEEIMKECKRAYAEGGDKALIEYAEKVFHSGVFDYLRDKNM